MNTLHEWRVTKYDPARRNRSGAFADTEWTAASDIGSIWSGRRFEVRDYLAIEDRYVSAALHFLAESGLTTLVVTHLELPADPGPVVVTEGLAKLLFDGPTLEEGKPVAGVELDRTIRLNLRSLVWCKLEAPGKFFLHFGHDYYMYVGSEHPCPNSIGYAEESGMFVEPIESPYGVDK